ncbi:MAG TPA: hypothetical protein VJ991_14080 [Balneolales bacterium]|nr:hypothetical protein [Balneolales bacterium]HYX05201.1 hypothetical protein [Bacteroidales bacterium]
MITLYRNRHDQLGVEVENKLRDIVIAHEVKIISNTHDLPFKSDGLSLPVLKDDDNIICGEKKLMHHLEYLQKLMSDWDRFQSDTCYIDDDGTIC